MRAQTRDDDDTEKDEPPTEGPHEEFERVVEETKLEPPFEPKRKPIPGRLSPRHKTPNGMAVTIWATLPEQTTTTALPSFKPLVCEKSPKAVNETEAARPIKAHINANRRESWKPNFTEDADSENNAPARAPARISLIRCCLNSTLFAFSLLSFLSLLSFSVA